MSLKILLIEPFYTGSHQSWADGLQQYSRHEIKLLTLPGHFWKWRMHGGAVTLARQMMDLDWRPDLILTTDMLDLATFLALTRTKTAHIPTVVYFHENQLAYPWSPLDADVQLKRDNHYGFINYTTALAADRVLFNSDYNQNSLLDGLPGFLKQFPDHQELSTISNIGDKSQVMPLGLDLLAFNAYQPKADRKGKPLILWNHRWEYDKNPETFFKVLFRIKEMGLPFQLVVLGESYEKQPPIFEEARQILQEEIVHWGYVEDFEAYAQWLWKADLLPVTSNQDFFGGSVVQAMYCNTYPLLPNRLAFPEHVKNHEMVLYDDEESLFRKLEQTIDDIQLVRQVPFQNEMLPYDWSQLIGRYDDFFDSMASNTDE